VACAALTAQPVTPAMEGVPTVFFEWAGEPGKEKEMSATPTQPRVTTEITDNIGRVTFKQPACECAES
jgi:hypothetical protein